MQEHFVNQLGFDLAYLELGGRGIRVGQFREGPFTAPGHLDGRGSAYG